MDDGMEIHLRRVGRALAARRLLANEILLSEELVNFLMVRILGRPFPAIPLCVYRSRPYRAFNDAMQRAVDYLDRTMDFRIEEMLDLMSQLQLNLRTFRRFSDALRIHYSRGTGRTHSVIPYSIHLVYVAVLFYRRGVRHVFSMSARLIERSLLGIDMLALNDFAEAYSDLNMDYELNYTAADLSNQACFRQLEYLVSRGISLSQRLNRPIPRRSVRTFLRIPRRPRGQFYIPELRDIPPWDYIPGERRPFVVRYLRRVAQQEPRRNRARKTFSKTSKSSPSTSGNSESSRLNEPSCSKEYSAKSKVDSTSSTIKHAPPPRRSKRSNAQDKIKLGVKRGSNDIKDEADASTSSNIKHSTPPKKSKGSEPPPKRSKCSNAQDEIKLREKKGSNDIKDDADALTSTIIKQTPPPVRSPPISSQIPPTEPRRNVARKSFTKASNMLPSKSGTDDLTKLSKISGTPKVNEPYCSKKLEPKSKVTSTSSSRSKTAPKSSSAQENVEYCMQKSSNDEEISTDIKDDADASTLEPTDLHLESNDTSESDD